MEEGTQRGWLYEILAPHAEEVAVVNVSESRGRRSTNETRSDWLRSCGVGAFATRVFREAPPYRKLRELARVHMMVVLGHRTLCDSQEMRSKGAR